MSRGNLSAHRAAIINLLALAATACTAQPPQELEIQDGNHACIVVTRRDDRGLRISISQPDAQRARGDWMRFESSGDHESIRTIVFNVDGEEVVAIRASQADSATLPDCSEVTIAVQSRQQLCLKLPHGSRQIFLATAESRYELAPGSSAMVGPAATTVSFILPSR
jgi:hypothetical protein